jgi:hypothetical protein
LRIQERKCFLSKKRKFQKLKNKKRVIVVKEMKKKINSLQK